MSSNDSASTFAKGLSVLACFETGRRDLTMADIARLTGFDRATVRRLCLTLLDTGYLSKRDRSLCLTPRVLALAGGYLTAHDYGRSIQPVLNQFAEELDGEISLAIRDEGRAIYVARSAMASARVSLGFSVGSTLPLLHTAIGRMLLARTPFESAVDILAKTEMQRLTEATDVDLWSIKSKIQDASAQGYAVVRNEFEMGMCGIAVPVGVIGSVQSVLGTVVSVNHVADPAALDHILDVLRRTAMTLRGQQAIT
ncbi:MAG: IclR family transcriptional regulator C-terminal domain-containing protein [Paracoccaceae bacterium]